MADEKNIPLYVDPTILARDLSNSLSVASRSTTSPDDESQLRAASRRLGIPLETARTDPAATKQAVAQESFDATDYAKRFPTSAAYLANPDNALVARDDVEPLSAVEQAIRGQIQQNMLGDLGTDPAQAATDRLLPDYAAERREREQVLRTEGFAAASALSRRQQQRRELLRATGSIGEIRQPEATPGNILSGLATDATTGFKSAKLGLAQQIGDLFGDNEERTEQYNRQRGQLDFERQLATPEFDTNVARWTYGGFSSLAQTAPAVGLSVATGSPALGLSMMGLQTYGEAYGRYRGRDASRGMASLGAAGEASVEVLTEILPMRFAVDRLGKAGLTQFFAGFLGRDMAGEQIATLAQDAIDTAIANPTKTWNDYLAERPEAAIQTAFATLVQSGTLAAIGEGVGRLAGTIDREQYAADTANQNAQQLADLMTAAAASMTRKRDPQTFAQLVQGAAEDSGSSPTEIFIDARVLAPLLESAGMTPEQLAQSLPSVQEQLEEALATDGAVAIPIGEATAAFAGSGLEQEVVRNARVSEDAWTAAEAEEGAQLLAQLEQDAQKVLAEQTEAQAWEDSSKAVFDTLMGELSNAGRFTPDVNRAYATLVRNFYAVQASKLGITPQEMYAQFPLTVTSRAPGQQQGQVLDQYASSVTPEAKPGALTVQGVHFSTARRATLDGRFFDTGLKGAERARLAGLPEDSPLRSRVLAYVDEGAGVRPEQGVGSVEHGVTMSNIYDTGKDPLGLWTGADANTREQAVLDAGFDGYYVPGVMAVGGGKTSGVVALLGEAAYNVPTTERAAPAEAAAQAQSPLQAALDALDASNRLPAGQVAPSRLGELTERLEPELYATLAPTGMFEGSEPRYRADIIADARNSEVFNQSLSTRVPSAVRATEDALANVLAIDFASVLADEKTLAKNAATLRAMPNMRPTKARKPAKVVEQFVEHVVDNLLFLHDLMPAEQRDRAKLWYDGGRKMAEAWANRYGISEMQAAAAIAVLSPQNDWFQNVSAAERTADILFGMRDFQWDDAMSVEADRILGDKTDPKMELARGKKLSELLDRPDLAARWVRVFDQTRNSRAFNVLTPEGGAAGLRTTASGNPATMAWKTYDNIAAAISIYLDGRAENVFHQLGREHKVRNFYNNIFDPKSDMGFATIDTHAVAAGLLRPLAGADLEVTQNFGGAGSASSSITGLSGTYPIYLEAYRRAAEARGLLPREMQSITWEAVRGLFEGPRKNAMKAPANAIWERYKAGEIDQAQAQAEIVKLADHITPPTWTEAEFNDTPGRTYEGDAQRAIDERGDAGAGEAAEARVMFEVAPDPNDEALTEQWNGLSDAERLEISQQVAAQVVPKVLAELSTTGDFVMQLGGYLGATNPSMTLRLDRPELAVQAAKLLGHALAQDSMMVVTETQAVGTEPVGAVTISLPEGYGANEVTALYDRLFELQENGEPLVGGHTTANGQMTILNYSALSNEDLAGRINEHLGDEFQIHVDQVYSAFPQKSEYGYASDQQDGATAPGKSSAQRRPDRLRREATQLVREALAARAEPAVLNQGDLTDGSGNRTGRDSSGSVAPLEGAPTVEGATGPDPRLVAVAEQYARDNGIPLRRQAEFVEVDPERAARIAAAYEAMPHAPQDPAVKEAFENLIQQTMAQYRALEAAGYQFFLIDETNDPYAGNPWNAMRDLRANQRMGVFATEAGFGSGATELNVDDNPLLADTGLQWPYGSPDGQPKRVLANDLFRAVHDAFGHGLEGAGFRARGEENAWQAHVRLFTGSAVAAITTETRGQNSWLNYGPHGEANQTAKVEDTVFADQKTGLLPEWAWTEGRVADEAEQGDVFNQSAQTDTEAFRNWFGDSKVREPMQSSKQRLEDMPPLVVYHGTQTDFDSFAATRTGTTSSTFGGDQEVTRNGIFFAENPEFATTFATQGDGQAARVMPVYLSIRNPLYLDEGFTEEIREELAAAGFADAAALRFVKAENAWSTLDGEEGAALVAAAKAAGYDGIYMKEEAVGLGDYVEPQSVWVAFDPTQIKSAIGNTGGFDPADPNILNQPGQARATFNPSTLNIALLEKADLSSFLHETGHFFFEMQATLAAQPNAPAEIVADMQTLLDHVGYTGTAAEWLAQPLNARREAHETIAETFEQYLFEGKAPSAELQSVFRRFRSWLISVYRSLQQMLATNERASLNPEVAAVFDRMIATDKAIAAAQAVRQFEPLFRSAEDAGMEPEAWAEYQATLQEQQAEAIEELQARTLRDLKWLDNARGRKLKELQKAAQAQRKAVRDEVTAEVNEQPIYKAMEFLKFGSLTDEDGSQIQIEVTKAAKLNITELERMYPEGELGTGVEWRKLGYGKYGMLSDAGLHPDTVAEMFGFRSGRQLVSELLTVEPKASVIEGMTDQRMLERHGDISSPEAMAEAANEALANDARSRLVATELKAVTKATGSPATLTRAARQAAEQIVAAKPVRNLRPDLAAASAARARKAAEKAMASGDTAAAAQAKRTEILQVQLERAQRRTRQEHDKALAGFKKIFKGTNEKLAKSRDVAMVTAARAVLARYGLAPNTSAANAQAYQQLLENYDGAMAADIKSILQGLPPSVDFRDLTVEQFRGMRDVVNGLYYLSRRTRQMEIDGQKVDIDAIADELVAIVTERSGGTIPPLPGYTGTPTGLDKWKASLLSAKASLTRVEAWADNWGPAFKRYIWQPVSEATTVMRDKRNALVAQYRDLLKSIEKGITYNKIDAPELGPTGFVFNAGKSELLHAVLHSGNQSNLTKLLLGRGWGTLDANGQLDTSKWDQFITRMINEGVLTKADFDFAQGVWDLLETVKKDAQAAHKEMYGYYFNEVTADPINTPFGTYRGGYVPALADSLSSPDMAQKREQEELLHAGNSFMFPTTGKGFTQSRVFYNKPLELDLRAIGQHLDKVSRFAYLEPAIKDVAQLMGNKRVARALNGASPGAISDMLTPWLQRTARQSASMPGKNPKMNRFFNGLRSRTGLLFMFGNIVNTLQQLTGFSLAALKVPAPKLLRATAGYLANPMKMRQQVGERSPWLAERMANQSYAMQDQIDQILTNPNPYEQFTDFVRRHAYFLQQAMQNVMDPIIWTGAYDHATAQGATEKEARRYADETVRTTQGSFAPEDIAAFEVQSPFVRLFTQFYGYFNMWGNLIGNEANKAVREAGFVRASPRLMFIWFAGLAIPAFVAELISQGTPDDEDDEDGDGLLDEWLAMFFGSQAKSLATMIPIAGHGAVLVANQSDSRVWNDRLNVGPALSAGESAGKGLAAILTGEVFDEEFTKTEFRSLLTLLGLGTGLPVAPVARAGGYLFDVESGRKDPQSAAEMGIGIATGR